ncbi:MAG: hypothetical protein ACFFBP_17060 [Promethearchaeota archaeon]
MISDIIINSDEYQIIKAFDITIKLIKDHLQSHKEHMNTRIISFLSSELLILENQRSLEIEKLAAMNL